MNEQQFTLLLLSLALMLSVSYILRFFLHRFKMPNLLAPLLVGFIFQIPPLSSYFVSISYGDVYYFLAQLGIIFLLFLVGLRLNASLLRELSSQVIMLSILNMGFSIILGTIILLYFGYTLLISVIVSTALAAVAETTIAPILDELNIIKTKVASLILGSGIVDDVAEIMLASLASMIVGAKGEITNPFFPILGFFIFIALILIYHRLIVPLITLFNKDAKDASIFLLMISTALIFTFLSQFFKLGILLGAITAGLASQKLLRSISSEGRALSTLTAIAYGFLGPIFFFGVGLSVNLSYIIEEIHLTAWLLAANFLGKFVAAFIVGRMAKLNLKAIIAVGLGLSAKFSMGIIPVQIFYSANLIDQQLFSAFIAVSTITTIVIPFSLSYLVNKWRCNIT
ncbi:cation:proton antiporter [Candidatus Bathyarchaeota archaeon]|nr:cation:proton antiporter [Candidatus Bathyarchaeota archaeon]